MLELLLSCFLARTVVGWPEQVFHERRLRGPNCTVATCNNAENLCGEFSEGCRLVGRVAQGPEIWISTFFEFRTAGTYRRVEHGSTSRAQCLEGNFWLKTEYSGRWDLGGGSPYVNGFSLASVRITSAWLTLLKDEACMDKVLGVAKCFNMLLALKALCPCNNWNWANDGSSRERNIGMFCQPLSQCSLLNSVYLERTQYFSYNATASAVCFSKMNTVEEMGWVQPTDDHCVGKIQAATCPRGVLSVAVPIGGGRSIAMLMLLLRVLLAD